MVSIIIPTYNRGNTIERCILSLQNQTYDDFEIIIVDDNSSDNTEDIIRRINDVRVKYIKHNINKGANAARNTGILHANGSIIAFQDSDDEWLPNKLEIQVKELINRNVDIVASSFYKYMDGKKTILPKEYINDENICKKILEKNFFSTQTIIGKSKCFKLEQFDDTLPRFQDWELMIRLSQKYSIHFINEPLVNVYVQDDSITKDPKKAIQAINIIMDKHRELIDNNKKALAELNILLGNINYEMNNFKKCYYLDAIRYDKLNYKTYIRLIMYSFMKIKYNLLKKLRGQ